MRVESIHSCDPSWPCVALALVWTRSTRASDLRSILALCGTRSCVGSIPSCFSPCVWNQSALVSQTPVRVESIHSCDPSWPYLALALVWNRSTRASDLGSILALCGSRSRVDSIHPCFSQCVWNQSALVTRPGPVWHLFSCGLDPLVPLTVRVESSSLVTCTGSVWHLLSCGLDPLVPQTSSRVCGINPLTTRCLWCRTTVRVESVHFCDPSWPYVALALVWTRSTRASDLESCLGDQSTVASGADPLAAVPGLSTD